MLNRKKMEKDYRSLFEKYGYGTTVWSPLAQGFLLENTMTAQSLRILESRSGIHSGAAGLNMPTLVGKRKKNY